MARFQKGTSGNPGGRKTMPKDVRDAFRDLTPQCIVRVRRLIGHKDARIALMACGICLDRAWGKPLQASELLIQDQRLEQQEPARRLTPPEVLQQMGEILSRAEVELGLDPVTGLSAQQRMQRLLESGKPPPPELYAAWKMWRQTPGTLQ
jgi:hypothetical protein